MSAKAGNIKLRFRHGASESDKSDSKTNQTKHRFSKSMESLEKILRNLETIKTQPSWKKTITESSSMMELRPDTRKKTTCTRENLVRKTLDTGSFPQSSNKNIQPSSDSKRIKTNITEKKIGENKENMKTPEVKKPSDNIYSSLSNLDDEVFVHSVALRKEKPFSTKRESINTESNNEVSMNSVVLRKDKPFSTKRGSSSTGSHSEIAAPSPPSEGDIFLKKLDLDWEVFKGHTGRIFYYNLTTGKATWKPPRNVKPTANTRTNSMSTSSVNLPTSSLKSPTDICSRKNQTFESISTTSDATEATEVVEQDSDYEEMVRDSIRRSNEPRLEIPPGYAEYFDRNTGCIFYEDYVTEVRWYTALDNHNNLYFYTREDTPRSAWSLPDVPSILAPEMASTNKWLSPDKSQTSLLSSQSQMSFSLNKYEQSPFLNTSAMSSSINSPALSSFATYGGEQDVDKLVDKDTAKYSDCSQLDSGHQGSTCGSKKGEICWRFEGKKKWQTSLAVLEGNHLQLFKQEKDSQQTENPVLTVQLKVAQVWWKKEKRKQIILQGFGAQQIHIKAENEIDSWFRAIKRETLLLVNTEAAKQKAALETFSFSSLPNSPTAVSPITASPIAISPTAASPTTGASTSEASPEVLISGPFNAHKASPEELLKLLSSQPSKDIPGHPKNKLGRKGLSKSFRKMADNIVQKRAKPQDSLAMQANKTSNRRSGVRREESRRSKYLSRFLTRRPTHEELKAQGIIKDSSVFGCALFHQKMASEITAQVPEFLYKAIKKLEEDPENLATTGIYRVPGDVAKVQKIRIEVDQESYTTFEKTDDIHVLAGCIKLFLRELPDPLIPYIHHKAFVRAAMGVGLHKQDIARGLEEMIDKLDPVEQDTLYFVVAHLGKVAKADNKMGVDNLGLLFGQVLLWPDPNAVLDMKLIAESAKNCQVAEALIKFADNFSANSE